MTTLKNNIEETELFELNNDLYTELEKEWNGLLTGDREGFSGNYHDLLKLANLSLTEKQAKTGWRDFYFVLRNKADGSFLMLAKAVHVHPSSDAPCLKIMSLRTNPLLDSRNDYENMDELQRVDDLKSVLSEFVFNGLKLIYTAKYMSKQFKIYGNHQADTNFFLNIVNSLSKSNDFSRKVTTEFFTAKSYQKWLDITKRK